VAVKKKTWFSDINRYQLLSKKLVLEQHLKNKNKLIAYQFIL